MIRVIDGSRSCYRGDTGLEGDSGDRLQNIGILHPDFPLSKTLHDYHNNHDLQAGLPALP